MSEWTTTDSGLQYRDLQEGEGVEAARGDLLAMHYEGTLEDGTVFDSSYKRGMPFEFQLGVGMVIKGWDEGVQGMQKGTVRELIIPAELGYGEHGAGDVIPPGATLKFKVELVENKSQK